MRCWFIGVLLVIAGAVFAQTPDSFQTEPDGGGGVVITRYTGPDGNLAIPASIGGKPVTAIGDYAFYGPFESFRLLWINTAMYSSRHKFLAATFYSPSYIASVLERNKGRAEGKTSPEPLVAVKEAGFTVTEVH